MSYIYTCQRCRKQYMVYEEGEYICECGRLFHYPSVAGSWKAHLSGSVSAYPDIPRHGQALSSKTRRGNGRGFSPSSECPLAKSSLICAILSIIFFGVLAPPALIMGFAARMMIADKSYHYTGDNIALTGIIIATLSFAAWSLWYISLL